jgi:hypothetical protein
MSPGNQKIPKKSLGVEVTYLLSHPQFVKSIEFKLTNFVSLQLDRFL